MTAKRLSPKLLKEATNPVKARMNFQWKIWYT